METLKKELLKNKYRWLITGVAGFIGSNIAEFLILSGQKILGIDNFITGKKENIEELLTISKNNIGDFSFEEGDICSINFCLKKLEGIDFVIHQAALGSVPRSIERPLNSHKNNVESHLNIMEASRIKNVKKVIYASSSSVYGDYLSLPKVEKEIGAPLSPYAATKRINEIYADVYFRCFGLKNIGIRYFNIFGKRQDCNSSYAAVIPKWIKRMLSGESVDIYGDGETTRDFCHVKNAVYMNIIAALSKERGLYGKVLNCACGQKTSLNQLYLILRKLIENRTNISALDPIYRDIREGDIRESLADYSLAKKFLDYRPLVFFEKGIEMSVDWYLKKIEKM